MKIEKKPLAEITTRAIEVLSKELGPADTLRFMNQFTKGHGDYTSERDMVVSQGNCTDRLATSDY